MSYWVVWEDGEEEGPFGRESQAREAAEETASANGYSLKWLPSFGGANGMPTDRGEGIRQCKVERRND